MDTPSVKNKQKRQPILIILSDQTLAVKNCHLEKVSHLFLLSVPQNESNFCERCRKQFRRQSSSGNYV